MELPNPKDLKRLADMCRKAGIKHFKSGTIEFTLNEEAPVSRYKKTKAVLPPSNDETFTSDTLTDDELMFWSTGNPVDETASESKE